jgi:hypothetical protein
MVAGAKKLFGLDTRSWFDRLTTNGNGLAPNEIISRRALSKV